MPLNRKNTFLSLFAFICLLMLLAAGAARADSVSAAVHMATDKGDGAAVGIVTFSDDGDGVAITVNLTGLPPGEHGFHVHEKADCGPLTKDGKTTPAGAAGGHYDPDKTGRHKGPGGMGHKGDLPLLKVAADGSAKGVMHLKGVKASDFKNRSLMIHAGGDTYSDEPEALGGGGARMACGVLR